MGGFRLRYQLWVSAERVGCQFQLLSLRALSFSLHQVPVTVSHSPQPKQACPVVSRLRRRLCSAAECGAMRLRANSAIMARTFPCCAALLLAIAGSGARGAQAGPKRTYLELPSLQERWTNQLPRPDKEQYTHIQVIIPRGVFPPAVLHMDDD